jgi:hypothetical protein
MKKINIINTTALILSILQLYYHVVIGTLFVIVGIPFPDDLGLQDEFKILFDQHPFFNDLGLFVHHILFPLMILAVVVVILNFVMMLSKTINKKKISTLLMIPPFLFIAYAILLAVFVTMLSFYLDPSLPISIPEVIAGTTLFSTMYLLNLGISILVALIYHKRIFKEVQLTQPMQTETVYQKQKMPKFLLIIILAVSFIIFLLIV